MKSRTPTILGLAMLGWFVTATGDVPTDLENGELIRTSGEWRAWSAPNAEWLTVEAFWLDYAERTSGRYWGSGVAYPPYREVDEHDTFLVELEQGPCLMYFFHGRWRRAEDVRRWDPSFNNLLGCPYVFD